MAGSYTGDFARLRDAVNSLNFNLLDLVDKIRDVGASIGTASAEIAKGNQDLNQRTTEQATSSEETANSLRALTETVRQNAQNARLANQLATTARGDAENGGNAVANAVAAMVEINAASRKIADIIVVIDGIAFQTNLLALNAAVEAARAGEQGRGFAAVAVDVRNLGQRSAGAAREIKALIGDSVANVDKGTRLVNESGATLQTIVGSVTKVSDIVSEIAEASAAQQRGIEELNHAISAMDEPTQQNAALVEEVAAASRSMDTQA
jgi:methyl-accepting chemotaxis protein